MKEQMMTWFDVLESATFSAVNKVFLFLPNLVVAVLVLVLATILGRWLGALAEKILGRMKVGDVLSKLDLSRHLDAVGIRSFARLIGKLVYLFVFLIGLIAAADIVHVPQVSGLIRAVVLYVPKAVVALLVVMVGLWAAGISDNFLKGDIVQGAPAVKGLVKFLIITFAVLAALAQFDVSPRMIEILFGGLVFAMALAMGLAFGLGGKEAAKNLLEKFKEKGRSGG